jgi:hypothetical protein
MAGLQILRSAREKPAAPDLIPPPRAPQAAGRAPAREPASERRDPGLQETLAALAQVHGYTTAFWWAAAIFACGAVVAGLLFRRGGPAQPARPAQTARPAQPARPAM